MTDQEACIPTNVLPYSEVKTDLEITRACPSRKDGRFVALLKFLNRRKKVTLHPADGPEISFEFKPKEPKGLPEKELEALERQVADIPPQQQAEMDTEVALDSMQAAIAQGLMDDARFWSHVAAETKKGRNWDEVIAEANRLHPHRPKRRK